MATSRQESDCAPERKRARVVVESSSTPLSSSSSTIAALPGWEFTTTSDTNVQTSYYHLAAATNAGRIDSPIMNGNSNDSISLSGSEKGGAAQAGAGCGASPQKPSPIATPVVVSNMNSLSAVPKSMIATSGLLQTPPIVTSSVTTDLRSCLVRSSTQMNEEPNANGAGSNSSAIGVVAPWQLQDFGDGLTFDGSLSGLSDLAGSGYINEMMEFVKRQSNPMTNCGENFFQYILMAPTSAAVKLHEEPLTYLNQGQSYEIKCKKLGAEGLVPGRLFKSAVRITFHDRRQKFQERELMDQWKNMHAGIKLMEADIPMSYNIFNVKTDPMGTMLEFLWDPTKCTSVFVKVNCISTEFTARKHGGEKGVPFRLQVDTYLYGDDVEHKHLHSSYAQVKMFKTKGADRKNKTDREKAEKRAEKEKYQPAYDYTVLTETFPSGDGYDYDHQQQHLTDGSTDDSIGQREPSPGLQKQPLSPPPVVTTCTRTNVNASRGSMSSLDSGVGSHPGAVSPSPVTTEEEQHSAELPVDATPAETTQWLRRHRFGAYLNVFSSFSGADVLRLSREDLIQICGIADGIRLFNALQTKKEQPKLTLYMCVPGAPAFHAVFLVALTLQELSRKVCDLIQVQLQQVFDVYCQGPDGINVHMNDEVVQNLPERSRYIIDAMKCGDEQSERYRVLLKAVEG